MRTKPQAEWVEMVWVSEVNLLGRFWGIGAKVGISIPMPAYTMKRAGGFV